MAWLSLMRSGIPKPWRGLCTVLGSTEHQGHGLELWWRKARESRIGGRLNWDELVISLLRDEPKLKDTAQLLFIPLLYHLPTFIQNSLLSFIYTHKEQISIAVVQKLYQTLQTYGNYKGTRAEDAEKEWLKYWLSKFGDLLAEKSPMADFEKPDDSSQNTPLSGPDRQCGESYVYNFTDVNRRRIVDILAKINGTSKTESDSSPQNPWCCSLRVSKSKILDKEASQKMLVSNSHALIPSSTLIDGTAITDGNKEQVESTDMPNDNHPCTEESQAKRPKLESCDSEESMEESCTISEDILLGLRRISEAWQGAVNSDKQDLLILAQCSEKELEEICGILNLSDLAETCVGVVCVQLASLRDVLPLSHARLLASHTLTHRIMSLETVASRSLHHACVKLTEAYPTAVIQTVILPTLTHADTGAHQSDLAVKLVKESLPADSTHKLVREYVESNAPLTSSVIAVLQAVLDSKSSLEDSTFDQLVMVLQQSSEKHKDNLKYGKLILALIKNYSSMLKMVHTNQLTQAMEIHKTFLKKSVMSNLTKLKS